jgi:hypothetical protein
MMDTSEVNIKEITWMSRMTYSVLKDDMKLDECGWSKASPSMHVRSRRARQGQGRGALACPHAVVALKTDMSIPIELALP